MFNYVQIGGENCQPNKISLQNSYVLIIYLYQ